MAKPKKKNLYFTQDHEDAIVKYAKTTDIKIRTELYINWIAPAFNEMVDKIIYTYKFTNLPNIDVLKDECKIWLTTILDKYDQLDKIPKNVEIRQFTVVNEYESRRIEKEFWMGFWQEVNSWETTNMKPNEEKVYEAIRLIFSNPDRIDIFNKKAIYFYIREITGLNTKQVVNNLNKMRVKYRVFKKKWDKGDL